MPDRHHARPARARTSGASRPVGASPSFLPPQPIYDRERGLRPGPRVLGVLGIGIALALITPLALSVLGPASGPLQPLAGGVAGAVSGSEAPAQGPAASPSGSAAVSEPSFAPGTSAPPPVVLTAPPISSLTGYQWPISQGWISLPFKDIPGGTRIRNGKLMHDGVDMASFCGARVGAAHDGVVLAAGRHFDEQIGWIGDLSLYVNLLNRKHMWNDLPNVVVIDDGNGYRSIYAHFRDVTVKVGQHVMAGEQIGHEGATGHASGCHVHYGLFSPYETATFGVRADLLRTLRLPSYEIARIDPLLVLPGGDVALRTGQVAKAIAVAKERASATSSTDVRVLVRLD